MLNLSSMQTKRSAEVLECAGRAKRRRRLGTPGNASGRPSQSGVALRWPCCLHGFFAPRAKKPRRGDLFIEEPRPTLLLFVFQRRGGRGIQWASQPRAAENQKEGGRGWRCCCYKQATPTGFEPTRLMAKLPSRPGTRRVRDNPFTEQALATALQSVPRALGRSSRSFRAPEWAGFRFPSGESPARSIQPNPTESNQSNRNN